MTNPLVNGIIMTFSIILITVAFQRPLSQICFHQPSPSLPPTYHHKLSTEQNEQKGRSFQSHLSTESTLIVLGYRSKLSGHQVAKKLSNTIFQNGNTAMCIHLKRISVVLQVDFSAKVILDVEPGPQNDTLEGSFQTKKQKKIFLFFQIITEKNTRFLFYL